MKLLLVQESDWLKRNQHQQHHLAELMSLKGHEIRVIDFPITWREESEQVLWSNREVYPDVKKIYDGAKATVIRPGFVHLPILEYISLMWTHYREIQQQLREFEPDVVVGFGILNSWIASRICGNTPFVYYWIDVLHELIPAAPFRWLGRLMERATLHKAIRTLAINKNLRDYMEDLSGKRTGLLGAGVSIFHFNKLNTILNRETMRKAYDVKENNILLFFMGWLYSFSGLAEVITSMKHRADKVKLLIVGDGDDYKRLATIRRELNLENRVFLAGKVGYDEIPKYIAAADVCILPAYPEHRIMKHIVPIKIYEYMAMGKPVLSTKLPAVISEFGDDGIVYVDKPEDMVSASMDMRVAVDIQKIQGWGTIANKFETILKGLCLKL